VADPWPPVITLFGDAIVTLTQTIASEMWLDPGYTAVDNLEGILAWGLLIPVHFPANGTHFCVGYAG